MLFSCCIFSFNGIKGIKCFGLALNSELMFVLGPLSQFLLSLRTCRFFWESNCVTHVREMSLSAKGRSNYSFLLMLIFIESERWMKKHLIWAMSLCRFSFYASNSILSLDTGAIRSVWMSGLKKNESRHKCVTLQERQPLKHLKINKSKGTMTLFLTHYILDCIPISPNFTDISSFLISNREIRKCNVTLHYERFDVPPIFVWACPQVVR